MKIRITFNFDKRVRRAINEYYGRKGLASHADCETFIDCAVNGVLEDVCYDMDRADKAKKEKGE